MKRYAVAAVLAALLISPVLAEPDAQDAPAPRASAKSVHVHRVFDVMRKGTKIGTNTFDVVRKGDVTTVKTTAHVFVKVLFVTHRYDQEESETWKGGQLVSFKSKTDDNGTPHELSGSQSGGKMMLVVDGEPTPLPKSIAPASVWTPDIAKHPQLFDTKDGKRLAVRAQNLGEETLMLEGVPRQVQHVKLSGEFDRDLWFDDQGLVKLSLVGPDYSEVTAELRTSSASR